MNVRDYPTESIHLPAHRFSLRIARLFSVLGGVISFITAVAILFGWLFEWPFLYALFGSSFLTIPMAVILLIDSIGLLFYNALKKISLIAFGLVNFVVGLATILAYFSPNVELLSLFSEINILAGFVFLLLGNSLIISASEIRHRFHYAQLFLLIALLFALFESLKCVYYFIAFGQLIADQNTYFATALFFLLFSVSFLLTKANRGFVGLFVTDTSSSQLARLSFMYFVISPPLLGLLYLLGEKVGFLSSSASLSLLIVTNMLISVIITWINAKALYPSEIQNYLTKEALRINNITLELDTKELSSKMDELEKKKKAMADKLNNKQSLMDYLDRFE